MHAFFLGFLTVFVPDTIATNGLDLPPDKIQAGQVVNLKKSQGCHGKPARAGNAPDIQGVVLKDVLEASLGVENMPKIVLKDAEPKQIAIYLMSLAPDQARIRLGLDWATCSARV